MKVLFAMMSTIIIVVLGIGLALAIDYGAWLIYTHFALQFGWPLISFGWFVAGLFLLGVLTSEFRTTVHTS